MTRRTLICLCLLLILSLAGRGQERVYVRTDCSRYMPGDRIWFRCYLFEGKDWEPSGESLYIYTELCDTAGMPLSRAKVIQRDGIFEGYLDIPGTVGNAVCLLRAWTLNMASHPASWFVKAVPVGRASFRMTGPAGDIPLPEDRRCRVPASVERTAEGDSVRVRLGLPDLAEDEVMDLSLSVSQVGMPASSLLDYYRYAQPVEAWAGEHEKTQVLRGKVVRGLSDRPAGGARVNLICPRTGSLAVTEADRDGAFRFEGLDDPAGTQYVLKTTDAGGKDRYRLILEEPEVPQLAWEPRQTEWMTRSGPGTDEDAFLPEGTEHLLESSVVTARQEESVGFLSSQSDFAFGPEALEALNLTSLRELLRRVPGVFVIGDVCYIRAQTSILDERRPAALAIDGLIWEELELDDIDMQDVERVDIFKTGQTVLWGSAGGAGVVSITTKSGAGRKREALPAPNIRKVTLPGYQPRADFGTWNRETGKGNRSVLWIPQVRSEEILFPLGEGAPPVRIVLEGVTSRGRFVHEEWLAEER